MKTLSGFHADWAAWLIDAAVAELDEAELVASNWVELIKAWVRPGDRRLDDGTGVVEAAVGVVTAVLADNVSNRLELRSES